MDKLHLTKITIKNKYPTKDQARHIYKKVESGNITDVSTLKQDIEQDQELNKLDDTSRHLNPYRELIVNNAGKIQLYDKWNNG